ncbi:hypothetical protein BABINDRAFT_7727 [Babjeviella inositovora NRRL Y-12698]|uniref:Uncharacterized protein n=1 Tax=Babjeviella inositovora NRRL Y-12698 TaxID=984486 RepID=A0A1E3QRE2_9ASCO|nr:uncharacterized protein BABINDRAFT_7727 [Babjeviella inositovora NRRL Y-12698]ODQ80273.1 hypothetical protein BABINDRAFT_7727 [Babjeviella inositovora NRRL Y-12698]
MSELHNPNEKLGEITLLLQKIKQVSPQLLVAEEDEIPASLHLLEAEKKSFVVLKKLVRLKKIKIDDSRPATPEHLRRPYPLQPGLDEVQAKEADPKTVIFNRGAKFDEYIAKNTRIHSPSSIHRRDKSRIARTELGRDKPLLARAEEVLLEHLESLVTLLDNINLLQRFVKRLKENKFLEMINTHTAKIWVFTLVFMIRKSISDLIERNTVLRHTKAELVVFLQTRIAQQKLAVDPRDDAFIQEFYTRIEEVQHERSLILLELSGNVIDFAFVLTEVLGIALPGYVEGFLSLVSGLMSWYRISKVNSKSVEKSV